MGGHFKGGSVGSSVEKLFPGPLDGISASILILPPKAKIVHLNMQQRFVREQRGEKAKNLQLLPMRQVSPQKSLRAHFLGAVHALGEFTIIDG